MNKKILLSITIVISLAIIIIGSTYAYEHPELTHEERKAYWRQLEKTYLPHKTYQDNAFLEGGAFWERQHHVFENPLYYLDYTIAQVVSLEFFSESVKDHKKAALNKIKKFF